MHASPRLGIDYLAPQQAQKHVTVNEGFRRLDALVQLAVVSAAATEEPDAPAEGDAYLIPAGASGAAWSEMETGAVAVFQDGAWAEIAPQPGWRAFDLATAALLVFDGAVWSALSAGAGIPDPLEVGALGVNAAPDGTNRFAVKSDAALFSHDDVTPGSGDMRLLCNKAGAGDTASFLFQTGYEGRAEFGLAGDDDFHLKVSADGETWNDAIVVDRETGEVAFPNTALGAGGANLAVDRDATTVTVESDSGTDAVLPAATASLAGVMSASDKTKLDGIASGATATPLSSDAAQALGSSAAAGSSGAAARADHVHPYPSAANVGAAPSSHVGEGGSAHANATTSVAGFMSAADKTKLDGVEAGATADMTGGEIAAALDSHLAQTVWRTDLLAVPAARTTASETLALSDGGAIVRMNSGSAQTLTVPPNSSVAFPVGAIVLVHQYGAGQVTIAAGSGVTIRAAGSKLKIAEQYGEASLKKIATDEWTLSGNLAA